MTRRTQLQIVVSTWGQTLPIQGYKTKPVLYAWFSLSFVETLWVNVKQLCCMRTTMIVRDVDFMATALAGNDASMYVLSQPSRLKLIPLLSNYYGRLCVQSATTAL